MSSGLETHQYDLSRYGFAKPLTCHIERVMSEPTLNLPYFSHLRWMESVVGILVPQNKVWWARVSESMVMHGFLEEAAKVSQDQVRAYFEVLPDKSAPELSIYAHKVPDSNRLASFCRRRFSSSEQPNLKAVIF